MSDDSGKTVTEWMLTGVVPITFPSGLISGGAGEQSAFARGCNVAAAAAAAASASTTLVAPAAGDACIIAAGAARAVIATSPDGKVAAVDTRKPSTKRKATNSAKKTRGVRDQECCIATCQICAATRLRDIDSFPRVCDIGCANVCLCLSHVLVRCHN